MKINKDMKKIFSKESLFTIPNAISLFRLFLIPLFIWLYLDKEAYVASFLVIELSWFSDFLDGKIARHYNMISDFGKLFDPAVDKLTQLALFLCLLQQFPNMLIIIIVLVTKEFFMGILNLLAMNKSNVVESAQWPGKITTAFLYISTMVHVLLGGITAKISNIIIGLCVGLLLFTFAFYGMRYIRIIIGKQNKAK